MAEQQKKQATVVKKPAGPAQSFVDEQTFRGLVRISSVGEVLASLGTIIALVLFPSTRQNLSYCIVILVIMAMGLLYNLFIWQRWHKNRPHLAIQLAILPPIVTFLIVAGITGGVSSPWYPFWIAALVFSGVSGTGSVYMAGGLTVAFYVYCYLAAHHLHAPTLGDPMLAAVSVVAVIGGYLIGRGVKRMAKTMQVAEALTNQLDGAEMKQQLMMSSIADAVVAVDLERKVVIFNEASQALTGWDSKQAVGTEYNLIFKLKDANDAELTEATDPFVNVLKSGQATVTDNFFMLNRENQKISFSISIAPTLDAQQVVNGAIAVFHDISDQKALARERNEFISTASHEMRTPVAAIEGYLSMAMNPSLSTVDERGKGFINKAHDASLHLGKLFKDLLSVTKIEDNRIIVNQRVFNFTELVTQVASEMEIIAKQKNIKVLTHLGGDSNMGRELVVAPMYQVNADPDRIREVLANLVENAVKYSKEGTVDISLSADKHFATLAIKDMGIGISPEDQKHLFQKFYRVNNSFTREVGGTGLGLYIARNLIERFGGRIWVESKEGSGSTFSFTLPLATTV